VIFRSFNEIVNSMLSRLKLVQPNLDTKPGTVARDLFVDVQAEQLEKLHRAISLVSKKQSLASATGQDLDRLSRNFSLTRRGGSVSTGTVVFTISDIVSDISIPDGTIVSSRSGVTFRTVGTFNLSSSEKNMFAANANKMRTSLDLAGISDRYAVEIPVQAVRAGTSGNVGTMQIVDTSLQENMKVINIGAFSGGSSPEPDSAFRSRILAIFSGSNVGTASGYKNAALDVSGIIDVMVVEPGSTLMLRDGTEIIEVNDGTSRILNSGTGGKVDLYILGRLLNKVTESFIYSDISGSGDAFDERNDYILGVQGQDITMTADERRLHAFKSGNMPFQPVDSIVQVSGTRSGIFSEKFTDANGVEYGNYELLVDDNVDTGGTPFGLDRLHWVSNNKSVSGEIYTKSNINEIEVLSFSDVSSINRVYRDVQIFSENSTLSSSDKTVIKIDHTPIVKISRITNKTTGEVYSIENSNIDSDTGLNETGLVSISGRTLPNQSDILSVDYTWRMIYDPYIDYSGKDSSYTFKDESVSDSIDWGTSCGIFEEATTLSASDDGIQFFAEVDHGINRVVSVYSKDVLELEIQSLSDDDGNIRYGLKIDPSYDSIKNIISIKNSNSVEIYNTSEANGTFVSRTIYLPSDSASGPGESVTLEYNKVEMFDLSSGDGAYFEKTITLPSSDILKTNDAYDSAKYSSDYSTNIYVKYVGFVSTIAPSSDFSLLPISGSATSRSLFDSNLNLIENSNQPVFYEYGPDGSESYIARFGPSRLDISVSNTTKSGKIKVSGTTLSRIDVELVVGNYMDNLKIDLSDAIKEYFEEDHVPSNIGIARVDCVYYKDEYNKYDLIGSKLLDNKYAIGVSGVDTGLSRYEFSMPKTINNLELNPSSGDTVTVSFLAYKLLDSEDLYFFKNESRITKKVYSYISRISVSSGFRNSIGSLIGSLSVLPTNQPNRGSSYLVDYDFSAPKEGERITIQYNINKLVGDATVAIESVRPITSDVLVKEAEELLVDVSGTLLINDDAIGSADSILQDVTSVVTGLLNTFRLGSVIDYSDIISAAAGVTGVDSVDISLFNVSGETGRKSFIKSLDNQTISPGSVLFSLVTREEFRIS